MNYVAIFKHTVNIPDMSVYFNRCCYGGDVIGDMLQRCLHDTDFKIDVYNQEDWGWFIWLHKDQTKYAIDIGMEEQEDDLITFKVFVTARTSWFYKFLNFNRTNDVRGLCQIIDRCLSSNGVTNIKWFESETFGSEGHEVSID